METLEHLRSLFRYNDWTNRRIIASLAANDLDKARRILAHLLTTEQEYFDRLTGKDSTGFDFWPDLSIEECSDFNERIAGRYEELFANSKESDLETIARYKTSEGAPHENTWRELFAHVIIHSSIHRGSIMLKLRESGIEPPKIDYIIYLRQS